MAASICARPGPAGTCHAAGICSMSTWGSQLLGGCLPKMPGLRLPGCHVDPFIAPDSWRFLLFDGLGAQRQ